MCYRQIAKPGISRYAVTNRDLPSISGISRYAGLQHWHIAICQKFQAALFYDSLGARILITCQSKWATTHCIHRKSIGTKEDRVTRANCFFYFLSSFIQYIDNNINTISRYSNQDFLDVSNFQLVKYFWIILVLMAVKL
jgi:fatty-acid desaturase